MTDTPKLNNAADGGLRTTDLFGWLRDKVVAAEKALESREAMANPPTISEEEWEKLKSLPGTIVGKSWKPSKAKLEERRLELLRHKRIAVKCRHELELAKAAEKALHHCRLFIVDRKGYIADESLERELIKQELEAKFPLPNAKSPCAGATE